MRILWCCQGLLDYRNPVYQELNDLNNDNFYVIFSQNNIPVRVSQKLKDLFGERAISIENEGRLVIGKKTSDYANSYLSVPYPQGLMKAITSINPDILITDGFFQWAPYVLYYSLRHKKKSIIFYERTMHTERNAPLIRTLYRRVIGKFADGFIINGSLTKIYMNYLHLQTKPMIEGCMVADSENLSSLAQSCDKNELKKIRRNLDINCGLIYLYVGQMVERKGVANLLDAWVEFHNEFPNDTLLLVGDGVLLNKFKKTYLQSSIKFIGSIDYYDIYKYYSLADIMVMPTLEDNWSLVIPEAMSCGLPIACSIYNGGYPELIYENENGYLFNPLEKKSIVNVLSKFHKSDLKEFGKKSLEIVKNYTPKIAAEKIYNFCIEITKKNNGKK